MEYSVLTRKNRNSVDPTRIDIYSDPTRQHMSGTTVHGNIYFDVPFISQITDDLWMGGCENNLVLPEHIDHLVSLYPWESYDVLHNLSSTMTVRMYDAARKPNVEQVKAIASWVNMNRRTGPVLVHCQAGLNRSGLITAAALILDGMTATDAIALLREQRSPAVLCNKTFEKFLHTL